MPNGQYRFSATNSFGSQHIRSDVWACVSRNMPDHSMCIEHSHNMEMVHNLFLHNFGNDMKSNLHRNHCKPAQRKMLVPRKSARSFWSFHRPQRNDQPRPNIFWKEMDKGATIESFANYAWWFECLLGCLLSFKLQFGWYIGERSVNGTWIVRHICILLSKQWHCTKNSDDKIYTFIPQLSSRS